MPFNPDKKSPFQQPTPDPKEIEKIKQEFDEIARRNAEEGQDRSKEPFVDIEREIKEKPYEKFRQAHKKRKERERARKTKNLATDAQRMEWNDSRRGGEAGL